MAKRIVTTDDATGAVVSTWRGGDDDDLAEVSGRTHRVVPDDGVEYHGKRWNGSTFEAIPPAPVRVLSPLDFARRFSLTEEAEIDTLSDSNKRVKAWMRRLSLAGTVNLDHPDVALGLQFIKSVGIPSVWANEAQADRRIAEILV